MPRSWMLILGSLLAEISFLRSEISSLAAEAALKDSIIKLAIRAKFRYLIVLTMKTAMAPLDHIDDYSYFEFTN